MTHTTRQGFTLIELLVVISIIAILAGMLLPAVNLVRSQAQQANCASNQRQLAIGMLAYQNDYDQKLPFIAVGTTGAGYTAAASQAGYVAVAVASQELLAVWSNGDLTNKLFKCPSYPTVTPTATASSTLMAMASSQTAWFTTAATSATISPYAYDYSAPTNSKSIRVVLGDRPYSAQDVSHKKKTVCVFVDGHTSTLNNVTSAATGTNKTTSSATNSATVYTQQTLNSDAATNDNIFDDANDDGVTTSAGTGSATYAFLK